jgi:hypothetical protein
MEEVHGVLINTLSILLLLLIILSFVHSRLLMGIIRAPTLFQLAKKPLLLQFLSSRNFSKYVTVDLCESDC